MLAESREVMGGGYASASTIGGSADPLASCAYQTSFKLHYQPRCATSHSVKSTVTTTYDSTTGLTVMPCLCCATDWPFTLAFAFAWV